MNRIRKPLEIIAVVKHELKIKKSQKKIGKYVYNPQTEITITSTSW
jgi:hypothetical protein